MSLNRVMLYDFFMKFPRTMIPSNEITEGEIKDFSERYSYFHWQPDREEYNLYLRYLLSKDLVQKRIISNEYSFYINQNGKDVLGQMQSSYYKELAKLSKYIKQSLSNLSDTKVESMIIEKLEGVQYE
nr:ABC-three component system middle component 2 [Paenibacillus sp. FSL H7-0326]